VYPVDQQDTHLSWVTKILETWSSVSGCELFSTWWKTSTEKLQTSVDWRGKTASQEGDFVMTTVYRLVDVQVLPAGSSHFLNLSWQAWQTGVAERGFFQQQDLIDAQFLPDWWMRNFSLRGLEFDGVTLIVSGMPGFHSGASEGKP
jgi:hypothetical protein